MCTYRNVSRSLLATAMAVTTLAAAGTPASAQYAAGARADSGDAISIVAAGDAVVWTHDDGRHSTLYSARAPEYRPSRLSTVAVGGRDASRSSAGAVSPDGGWILYLRDGLLYRLPAEAAGAADPASRGTPLFETIGLITHAAWSPDGSRIAFVMVAPKARAMPVEEAASVPSFVGVYDLKTGRRWFLSPSRERDASPVWTPNGDEIFFQRKMRAVGTGDAAEGTRTGARSTEGATGSTAVELTSCLMVGDVATGEVRVLWSDAEDAVVLIGPGGSSRAGTVSAAHAVAPPLAAARSDRSSEGAGRP